MNESVLIPEEFRQRIMAEEAVDGAALLAALQEAPSVGVRLNPAKPGPLPEWLENAEAVPWAPGAFYLDKRPEFTLEPTLHAGAFYVQDPSSAVYSAVVGRLAGDTPVTLLDSCAAPGGKTTAAIGALPQGSVVVANEAMRPRASVLAENIVKWGNPDVIVTSSFLDRMTPVGSLFDIIIADAPCSGEGMMRKDETARTQWTPGLVESCAALQREILDSLIPILRPGGHLIFSTCTFSRAENEDNVHRLMDLYGLESVDMELEKLGVPRGWSDRAFCYRFMPHLTRGEGMFLSVLRKPEAGDFTSPRKVKAPKVKTVKGLPDWLADSSRYVPVETGNSVRMLSKDTHSLLGRLKDARIPVIQAGVELGSPKGRDFIPAHALALSTALRPDAFPDVALDRDQALDYLRRNPITLPDGTPRGFVTVSYAGRRLGFMKNIGSRANSLYPQAWRIRNL